MCRQRVQHPGVRVAAGHSPVQLAHVLREAHRLHADQGLPARRPDRARLPALPP